MYNVICKSPICIISLLIKIFLTQGKMNCRHNALRWLYLYESLSKLSLWSILVIQFLRLLAAVSDNITIIIYLSNYHRYYAEKLNRIWSLELTCTQGLHKLTHRPSASLL